jgi:hypothetical protein
MSDRLSAFREMTDHEASLLHSFACAIAPALVPFSMQQKHTLQGVGSELQCRILSSLTYQAAGVMMAEYLQRVSGNIPTHGVNVPFDFKAPEPERSVE